MSARCLRCGAGNEWIAGTATLREERATRLRLPAVVNRLERFKAEHGDWPAVGSKEIGSLVRALRRAASPLPGGRDGGRG